MGLEGFFWTYRTGRVSSDLLFGPWCSGHLPLSTSASLALGSWVNGLEPHSLVVLCPWVGDSGHGSPAAAEQRAAKARPELLFVWSSRDAGTAGISSVGCGMVHLPRFLSCCCCGQIKMAGVLQLSCWRWIRLSLLLVMGVVCNPLMRSLPGRQQTFMWILFYYYFLNAF